MLSPGASCTLGEQQRGMSPEEEDLEGTYDRACRFCFDSSTAQSPLVSPCGCRGSQQWVHVHCLRSWQACVLSGKLGADVAEKAHKCVHRSVHNWGCRSVAPPPRLPPLLSFALARVTAMATTRRALCARRCSVCLTRFSLAPLRPGTWQLLSNLCHGALLALACLLLLAATGGSPLLAGAGWQHVALVTLLLLLGARWVPAAHACTHAYRRTRLPRVRLAARPHPMSRGPGRSFAAARVLTPARRSQPVMVMVLLLLLGTFGALCSRGLMLWAGGALPGGLGAHNAGDAAGVGVDAAAAAQRAEHAADPRPSAAGVAWSISSAILAR